TRCRLPSRAPSRCPATRSASCCANSWRTKPPRRPAERSLALRPAVVAVAARRLTPGAQGAERRVDEQDAAKVEYGLALTVPPRMAGPQRGLSGTPAVPARDRPQQERLVVVAQRGLEGPDQPPAVLGVERAAGLAGQLQEVARGAGGDRHLVVGVCDTAGGPGAELFDAG